jgi:glycine cleavage system H lipoate-binding protein
MSNKKVEDWVAKVKNSKEYKATKTLRRRQAYIEKAASEASVARRLREVVKESGGLIFKMHPLTNKGIPDYLVHMAGRTFYVETKTTGEECSAAQVAMHAELKKHGIETYVLDSRLLCFHDLYAQSYKTYETNENSKFYHKSKKL